MNMKFSVEKILEQGEKLLGENVSIDAALVIQGGEAYLVESVEAPESLKRIAIHCPGLELQLDLTVGGWMGGGYSYIDSVRIDGKLERGTVRKNRLVLSEVKNLIMTRDDESIHIPLEGNTGNC